MKTKLIGVDNLLPNSFCKKLVCTKGLSKLDWLKWRQKGIGGSDIASVCGVNPYKSGLALYYEKIEEIKEEEEENIPAELGNYLEPFMKGKFEKWIKKNQNIDIEVETIPYILQHPTNLIALSNIDGAFNNPYDTCLVEYKTTSERFYKEWEEDKLPDYHYLQTQWYLYVTNYRFCYLAFLIGNKKFDVKIIERNDEVIKQLVEKANYFWNTFVIPKVPPAPDGTISSGRALDLIYPKEEEGKVIDLSPTTKDAKYSRMLVSIDNLNTAIKEAQLEIDKYKQEFKAIMGDAEVAICGDRKITWKEITRKAYFVKESKSRQLRISKIKGGNENGN